MSTATKTDRVIVTCPDCGRDREITRKTYRNIRTGRTTARCQPCGNRARHIPLLAPPAGVSDWRVQAACRQVDPEMFFPHLPAGKTPEQIASYPPIVEAKAVCAGCAVREICLEQHRTERWGIWGGLTAHERGVVGGQK